MTKKYLIIIFVCLLGCSENVNTIYHQDRSPIFTTSISKGFGKNITDSFKLNLTENGYGTSGNSSSHDYSISISDNEWYAFSKKINLTFPFRNMYPSKPYNDYAVNYLCLEILSKYSAKLKDLKFESLSHGKEINPNKFYQFNWRAEYQYILISINNDNGYSLKIRFIEENFQPNKSLHQN